MTNQQIATHKAVKTEKGIQIVEKGFSFEGLSYEDEVLSTIPLEDEDDVLAILTRYDEDNRINIAEYSAEAKKNLEK